MVDNGGQLWTMEGNGIVNDRTLESVDDISREKGNLEVILTLQETQRETRHAI